MKNVLCVTSLALVLSACATTAFDPRACPPIREYTKAEQAQLVAALKKSPVVIQGVIVDYGKLRDMVRACQNVR